MPPGNLPVSGNTSYHGVRSKCPSSNRSDLAAGITFSRVLLFLLPALDYMLKLSTRQKHMPSGPLFFPSFLPALGAGRWKGGNL